MRIDQFESMKVFIAVTESGSFSAAARTLRVQQSTISRTVSALEDEFNTTLINRTTRKMMLTEAGITYLKESRKILGELDELNKRMKKIQEEPKGLLRIGLSTAFGKLVVLPKLPEFIKQHPGITLEIHHDDRLVDIIAEGYDVVIRVGANKDSLITSRKIAVVQRGLFVAKSLTKKLGPILTPQDLSRFPALFFNDQVPAHPKWTLIQGRNRINVAIPSGTSIDQLDGMHTLLKEGLGVAYAPLFFNENTRNDGSIERVLTDWDVVHELDATSSVYALFPGGKKASAKVRVFVDFLVKKLS